MTVNNLGAVTAYAIAVKNGFEGTEAEWVESLKVKSVTLEETLLASGWVDGVYTLSVDGVTADSNQEVLPALDITAEQLEVMQAANIQDGGQATNTITLKAYGYVPTIDLPVRVIKRGV